MSPAHSLITFLLACTSAVVAVKVMLHGRAAIYQVQPLIGSM